MLSDRLETERLTLRPPRRSDADRMCELIGNWNLIHMLAMPSIPYTRANAEDYLVRAIARAIDTRWCDYAITMDRSFVGGIGLSRGDGVDIGYWPGESHWGQGVMTEAVVAVIAEFFAGAEENELVSGIFFDNPASLAVQRKFGFEVVGESKKMCVPRGREVRHVDTRLTRAQ